MLKLLDIEHLFEPLKEFAGQKPILGTCAGTILLASQVKSPAQRSLGVIDMTVERNAYGRQVDSAIRTVRPEKAFEDLTSPGELEAVFIRAPIIREVRGEVRILACPERRPSTRGRGLASSSDVSPGND